MTAGPRPTDPAALREQEILAAKNSARLRERIYRRLYEEADLPRPTHSPQATSPPRIESSTEHLQRFQASEDAVLLSYCQGDAERVAQVRKTIPPEQITAWVASMETEPGWAEIRRRAEHLQRFQASEDAVLLSYCQGDAERVAQVRKTIPPEQITAWVASR